MSDIAQDSSGTKKGGRNVISKMGFLLFIIGAAGMDNHNLTVPVIMVLSGLAIMAATAIKENSPAQPPTKANVQD